MKHQMMYLEALESAKVELSLISKCNKIEKNEKQLALPPWRVGQTSVVWKQTRERWDDGTYLARNQNAIQISGNPQFTSLDGDFLNGCNCRKR